MQCYEARRLLATSRYEGQGAELDAHLTACDACRTAASRVSALDTLLDGDLPEEPRPGFDTRFFARLDELKREKPASKLAWWWYLVSAGSAAALALGIFALVGRTSTVLPAEDRELVANLELVENEDLLRHLDEVEAYVLLAQVDSATLERMAQERGR